MRSARLNLRGRRPLCLGLTLLGALAWALSSAFAGGIGRQPMPLPRYTQECAACHLAYPPGLLPAESWRRLLDGLARHFGTDASLAPAAVAELSAWLGGNAGSNQRVREAPPQDRITRSVWFQRKHDEVPAEVWKRPAVKSAADCAACHSRAQQGDFNEHTVRIPR